MKTGSVLYRDELGTFLVIIIYCTVFTDLMFCHKFHCRIKRI